MIMLRRGLSLILIALCMNCVMVAANTVVVNYSDFKRPVLKRFVGFNGMLTTAGGNPWKRRNRLLMCLERSKVRLLRYPGGEVGNYWDFNTGWVDLNADPNIMPSYIAKLRKSTNRYTLADLALAYRITQITPIFDLNMITRQENQLPQILKMIREHGLPLKYFELGNNFFPNNPQAELKYAQVFPTAKSYAKRADDWAEEIKDVDHQAKIAVAANLNSSPASNERQQDWNRALADYAGDADAYAFQFFFYSGIEPIHPSSKSTTWGSAEDQQQVYQNFRAANGVDTLLAQPYIAWFKDMQNTPTLKNTQKDLWVTEFNLRDPVGVVRHTWAHGLAVANALNIFLMDKRIQMANLFNVYSIYPKYTAIFPPNDIFLRLKIKPQLPQHDMQTTGWDLTAAGQIMQFFAEVMNGRDEATMLTFNPQPELTVGDNHYPAVFGWLFAKKGDSVTKPNAIIVNESPNTVWLDMSNLNIGKYRHYLQYSGDPREYVLSEHTLYRYRERVGKKLKLASYSITIIK